MTDTKHYDAIIIGAGTTGCFIAGQLQAQGLSVLLIEKSRGLGGRCSRRKVSLGDADYSIDLGAMGIDPATPSSLYPAALNVLQDLQTHGQLIHWDLKQSSFAKLNIWHEKTYLISPQSLNQLHKDWSRGVDIALQTRAHQCLRQNAAWHILDEQGQTLARGQRLISTVPAMQCATLLSWPETWQDEIAKAQEACHPQWVAAIALPKALRQAIQGVAFLQGGHEILYRAYCETAKTKYTSNAYASDSDIWLLESQAEWTQKHLDLSPAEAGELLASAFCQLFDLAPANAQLLTTHRWLLARNEMPYQQAKSLWHGDLNLGIAADWLASGDIAGALLSGIDLLKHIQPVKGE